MQDGSTRMPEPSKTSVTFISLNRYSRLSKSRSPHLQGSIRLFSQIRNNLPSTILQVIYDVSNVNLPDKSKPEHWYAIAERKQIDAVLDLSVIRRSWILFLCCVEVDGRALQVGLLALI